jgi:hypothetical protein
VRSALRQEAHFEVFMVRRDLMSKGKGRTAILVAVDLLAGSLEASSGAIQNLMSNHRNKKITPVEIASSP